jgi:hypothetical protein
MAIPASTMLQRISLLALAVVLVAYPVCGVSGPSPDCQWNGYDFTALQANSSDFTADDDYYSYWVHVCGPVVSQPECTSVDTMSSACQVDLASESAWSIGNWNASSGAPATWSFINTTRPELGVTYQLVGDSTCMYYGNPQSYIANVILLCARSAGAMQVWGDGKCIQDYEIPTPLACPAPPAEDAGRKKKRRSGRRSPALVAEA